MFGVSVSIAAAWLNVAIFALMGIANLSERPEIRAVYERWDIPHTSYRTLGLLEIVAAVLLAFPSTRTWGVALALPILFGWVIMLLDHRQYWAALAVTFALAAAAVVIVGSMSAADERVHYSSIDR